MWKLVALAALFVGNVYADSHGDNSISYDMGTFAKEVPKKPHFVMFFAPWCGHCKRLAPTWDELGEKYNTGEDAEVQIAKVDCTQHTELCSKHDVTGYPTLKIFTKSAESSARYRGPRDLANLERFIAEQLGKDLPEQESEAPSVPEPSGGLVEYTDAKYEKLTSTGKHFIKFYAPWCGHCQRLAPTWENLAKTFEYHPGLTVGKLDCTQYRDICSRNEVKGYPTLLWIEDGKKVEKYSGDRSIGDLKSFVARMLGASSSGGASEDRVEPEASPVVVLTGENFENAIEKGVTFVKFFAPWCGHCKRMAPAYDELGRKFIGHDNVKIAKVDCTQSTNRDLCSQQGVNGFPTVFLYRNGKRLSEYDGSRTLEDMFTFVTSNLTHDEL